MSVLCVIVALIVGFFWGASVTRDRVMATQLIYNEAKRLAGKV